MGLGFLLLILVYLHSGTRSSHRPSTYSGNRPANGGQSHESAIDIVVCIFCIEKEAENSETPEAKGYHDRKKNVLGLAR
jgi:hypothetical protein